MKTGKKVCMHLSGCYAYSHSSSNGRKGSRLYCHRHYRRRNERSFRLHHCTNRIYVCMGRNDSTSTSEMGLEQVLLFISDGLPGMTDAIHRVYPKAKHQVCCVHVARNIASKVRVKDRQA